MWVEQRHMQHARLGRGYSSAGSKGEASFVRHLRSLRMNNRKTRLCASAELGYCPTKHEELSSTEAIVGLDVCSRANVAEYCKRAPLNSHLKSNFIRTDGSDRILYREALIFNTTMEEKRFRLKEFDFELSRLALVYSLPRGQVAGTR